MKKMILSITLYCCIAFSANATYRGHVFVNKNGNGVFDKEEKAVAGVLVSDGLHVVKTAEDGSFVLSDHEKERFIFITTPSGYKTNNAYYQRIESGKALYDFAVQPYGGGIRKDGSHQFIHFSDTEINGSITNAERQDCV